MASPNISLSSQAAAPVTPSRYWPMPRSETTPPTATISSTRSSAFRQVSTVFSTTRAKPMKKTISRPWLRLPRGVTEVKITAAYTAAYSSTHRFRGLQASRRSRSRIRHSSREAYPTAHRATTAMVGSSGASATGRAHQRATWVNILPAKSFSSRSFS